MSRTLDATPAGFYRIGGREGSILGGAVFAGIPSKNEVFPCGTGLKPLLEPEAGDIVPVTNRCHTILGLAHRKNGTIDALSVDRAV